MHILPRPAINEAEFVPPHYFRELTREEICKAGRPLEIDLGCGDGAFLLAMAALYPERDFLGVERLLGRVKKVCKRIKRQNLPNARVLRLDSKYTVEWLLPKASVSRLHLLCPDPWPKVRHHRRRLLQDGFLLSVADILTPGGEFLFMTDHQDYHEWALEKINACPRLRILPWEENDFPYPKTGFQLQWEAEGKSMFRIRCGHGALALAGENFS